MEKRKITREVTASDVSCLENLVVAYNTIFFMSSIFIISLSGTAQELFSDFNKVLTPSVLLLITGCFIVLTAVGGYVGIAKKSSSIISLYTCLLVFIFIWEISAGFGILSYRKEIKSYVSSKMKKAMAAYPDDPLTASLVDYTQLEFGCCGVNNFRDWEEIFNSDFVTTCNLGGISLPRSCCTRYSNSSTMLVNKNGCLPVINFMFHRSTLLLTTAILAICTIQVLGAYFSYSLATTLKKYKIQTAEQSVNEVSQYEYGLPTYYKEKSNYF